MSGFAVSNAFGSSANFDASVSRAILNRQAERAAAVAQERALSSWNGEQDQVNISEAARKLYSGYGAVSAGDQGHAVMRAVTRMGAEVVLEANAVGRTAFTMGKFGKTDEGGPFGFSLTGQGGEADLEYRLTIRSSDGSVQQFQITQNTLLTEDRAGNISVREQTDGRLIGTDGQDILINITDNGLVDGGDGDDIIFNLGRNSTLMGGDGNDVIVSMGSGSVISGGAGDDAIAVLRDTIHAFKEDRRIDETGHSYVVGRPKGHEQVRVDGGDGNDYIVTTDLYKSHIAGGAGSDIIETGMLLESSLDGGDGSDDITVMGMINSTIAGGGGHDSIRIMQDVLGSTISGGSGNDEIRITGQVKDSKISGGSGDNIISIAAGSGGQGGVRNSEIFGGSGSSIIRITGDVAGSRISGGAGDDLILIQGTVGNSRIEGGDGDDTVFIHGTVHDSSISGGRGNDRIWIEGTAVDTQINGDAGDDDIFVRTFTTSLARRLQAVIDGGSGYNTIRVGTLSGNTVIRGSEQDAVQVDDDQRHQQPGIGAYRATGLSEPHAAAGLFAGLRLNRAV